MLDKASISGILSSMDSGAGSGPVYDAVVRMLRVIGDAGRGGAIRAISTQVTSALVPLAERRNQARGSFSTFDEWWDSPAGELAQWGDELGNYAPDSVELAEAEESFRVDWEHDRAAWLAKGPSYTSAQDILDACGIIAAAYDVPFDPDLIRSMTSEFVNEYPNWNSSKCF